MTDGSAASLREARASLTRRQVVNAASTLFLSHGYVGTSVGSIARLAGVSVQTIYNAVGNKSALLSAMLDAAASGADSPTPVPQFMQERTRGAPDAIGVIEVLADWFVEVNARTADVWSVIHQAAAVDKDAASVEKMRGQQRLHNYGLAAGELRSRGALVGFSNEEVAATIWAIGHPNVYQMLVGGVGWTMAAYREWVRTNLEAALRLT